MNCKRRKFDSAIYFDPNSIPEICYQHIFQYLPIESLISVSLTCKTWYKILSSNQFCYNKHTKLKLSNENQLIHISNSKILRHIHKIELGQYQHGLIISIFPNIQFHFTSLHVLKFCFISLTSSFLTNLFESISPTLQRLILAIQPYSNSNLHQQLSDSTSTCLFILSSLHLLSNLRHFSILVTSRLKIEFDLEKYFQVLPKLDTLTIRQDNYTWRKSRVKQLNAIPLLSNLKHLEWFEIIPDDLKILSSISSRLQLQYIHIEKTLITNEILYYLSRIPTINSIKAHRFSPKKTKLNLDGFQYLLALEGTLKELQISAKDIIYDELMIIQNPAEADCTEDEYEVHLNFEHVNILKQFIYLKCLSFNKINISTADLENLLIHLAQHKNLKVLDLEWISFPSFTILSKIDSLEELSLSYNVNQQEYTDKDFYLLSPLKNLKVLILYQSITLSKMLRKQLREQTQKMSSTTTTTTRCNSIFEHLEEFIYNDDQ